MIEVRTMAQGYAGIVDHVFNEGRLVSPRGMRTREVRDAVIEISRPLHGVFPVGSGRNLNLRIAAVEATLLVAGRGSLPHLDRASNGRFSRYSDDGITLAGAYGPRIRHQMTSLVKKLQDDPDTRQANLVILGPRDVLSQSKDVPCTSYLNFHIEDGRLCMTAHMRSSDVWLGLPYDVFQFTRLQAAVAGTLDRPTGYYRHVADSLHIYEEHWGAVGNLTEAPADHASYGMLDMEFAGSRGDWWSFVLSAEKALHSLPCGSLFFDDYVPKFEQGELTLLNSDHWVATDRRNA